MLPVIQKRLSTSYEATIAALPEALKREGFGVLTEIDMRETLKAKLGVDFRRYKIFGACNPPLAHRALTAELDVGVMLPCNVLVYEDGDGSVVTAVDPVGSIGDKADSLRPIADEVRARLARVVDSLT